MRQCVDAQDEPTDDKSHCMQTGPHLKTVHWWDTGDGVYVIIVIVIVRVLVLLTVIILLVVMFALILILIKQ